MTWLTDPQAWIALATLTVLEIVLGVDNIIFITILVGKVPASRRSQARITGLALAMLTRIMLLLTLTWMMRLSTPFFSVMDHDFSGRDLILIGGGLFLLVKSTFEIHGSLEGEEVENRHGTAGTFFGLMLQIALIDIIFSLDSVITAIGLARDLGVMIAAIVLAVLVMMAAAKPIGIFVDRHPTIKMLALSFLLLIGFTLLADGLGIHIPKGYIYFAMAFSVGVELLNLRIRKKTAKPVRLRSSMQKPSES